MVAVLETSEMHALQRDWTRTTALGKADVFAPAATAELTAKSGHLSRCLALSGVLYARATRAKDWLAFLCVPKHLRTSPWNESVNQPPH